MKKYLIPLNLLLAASSTVTIAGEFVVIERYSFSPDNPRSGSLCHDFVDVLNAVPMEERYKLLCSLPEFPEESAFTNITWEPMDDPIAGIKAVSARHDEPDNDKGWSERADWQLKTAKTSVDILNDGVERNLLQLSYLSPYCVPTPDYTHMRGKPELVEVFGGSDRQAFGRFVRKQDEELRASLSMTDLAELPWARMHGMAPLDPIEDGWPAKFYPADFLFEYEGKVWGYDATRFRTILNNPNVWEDEGDAGSVLSISSHHFYAHRDRVGKQTVCTIDYKEN